jgi:hypothetical protein
LKCVKGGSVRGPQTKGDVAPTEHA